MTSPYPIDEARLYNATRFADDDLPEGSVIDCAQARLPIDEAYDFVVIGSGAAGAVAAHELASAGYSVAIAEEGPYIRTREFKKEVGSAFLKLFRDGSFQALEGRVFMPVIQGRCVGGTTVVNSAIAWRTPEDVIDEWNAQFGLGGAITSRALEPHFEALERDLNVHAVVDEILGGNNALFLKQAAAVGLHPTRIKRYERGCKGTTQCLTGCPTAAKQGMNVTYVPWTLALGGRLFCNYRVERIELAGGRAVGVIGSAQNPNGKGTVRLRAKRGVILAASTVQSPNILRRSGVRNKHLGQHFQTHPGCGMGAVLDQDVNMYFGATQGAESIHLRASDRIKFETIAMNPELVPVRCPGLGVDLVRRIGNARHLAIWVTILRSQAEGTVSQGWTGRDRVVFSPTKSDMEHVRAGQVYLARMMFDAGAREVWPGIYGLPPVLTSPDQVKLVEEAPLEPRAYTFIASHLFGAARMAPQASGGVVDTTFAVHGLPNLFLVDSSVFPTNLGVNPQHSIMAMSRLATHRIVDSPPLQALA